MVRSATTRPVASLTTATVCDRLWVSAPITIICTVPSLGSDERMPGGHISVGAMPRSYQVTPGSSDGGGRHYGQQSGPAADNEAVGSARRRTRGPTGRVGRHRPT